MRDRIIVLKRPGPALGLLLFVVLTLFLLFTAWCIFAPEQRFFGRQAPILEAQQWIVLTGVVSAVAGWIIASIITIRNSIKQHTVNILLQSRLSATYMEQARHINKTFMTSDGLPIARSVAELSAPGHEKDIEALHYILNYLEFVAVGIRQGDLDEKLMKQTMRGIAVNVVSFAGPYIDHQRGTRDAKPTRPKYLEHLLWLDKRWRQPGDR